MAVKLIANYSKRLGLPGYSSHQYSVSVETEVNTTDDIAFEAERLYHNLQSNVDAQIQNPGFVAPHDYGMDSSPQQANAPHPTNVLPINNHTGWHCSEKQRDLILKLIDENNLEKVAIENLASERFGKGVKQLNKLEASSLIGLIFDTQLKKPAQGQPRQYGEGGQR
jgi:hypothetical protein